MSSTEGSYIRFNIKTTGGSPISGALVTAERFIGGSYKTISSKLSDDAGVARIFLDPTVAYRITVSKSGYITTTSFIQPTAEDYTIYLSTGMEEVEGTPFDTISYSITVEGTPIHLTDYLLWNTTHNQTINFTISDWNNTLEYYGMALYNDSVSVSNLLFNQSDTTSSGGTITASINTTYLNQVIVNAYFKGTGYDETTIIKTLHVYKVNITDYTLAGTFALLNANVSISGFAKAIISMIISSFTAMGIGMKHTIGGGIIGLGVLAAFAMFGWVSWWMLLFIGSVIFGIIYLMGRM